MGVASNRVDVHQACAAAERSLERRAEPLNALFARRPSALPPPAPRRGVEPPRAQQRARLVVRVQPRRGRRRGDAALPGGPPPRRRSRPRRRADRVARRSTRRSTTRWSSTRPPRPASGMVSLEVAGPRPPPLRRRRRHRPARPRWSATTTAQGISTVVVGQKIRWVLDMMRGHEFAGQPGDRGRPRSTRDRRHGRRRDRRSRRPGDDAARPRRRARGAARRRRGRAGRSASVRRCRRPARSWSPSRTSRVTAGARSTRCPARRPRPRCAPNATSSRTRTSGSAVDAGRRHVHHHDPRRRDRPRREPAGRRR